MTCTEKLELNIFTSRMAADELLFELRAGGWKKLPPQLLLEPPTFQTPGGKGSSPPRYLTALLPPHPYFGNAHLEISIMEQEYIDALHEIAALGYEEPWRGFFNTNQQLYRIERRNSNIKRGETLVVTQNRNTGKPERNAMDRIWRRGVVRPWRDDWTAF